jgi:hypothetical protein
MVQHSIIGMHLNLLICGVKNLIDMEDKMTAK